jgi:hypothetical protein
LRLPDVWQRPHTIEVFVIQGKQLLHNHCELGMFGGGLAHGAFLHEEVMEKLGDQALLVLELSQVGLKAEPLIASLIFDYVLAERSPTSPAATSRNVATERSTSVCH